MTMTSSRGSRPKVANCRLLVSSRTVRIRSLHFLGVSSAFPAKNRQQVATTWENYANIEVNNGSNGVCSTFVTILTYLGKSRNEWNM